MPWNSWRWSYPQALTLRLSASGESCDNPSLLHDKFAPMAQYNNVWGIGQGNKEKGTWLQEWRTIASKNTATTKHAQAAYLKRWGTLVNQFAHDPAYPPSFKLTSAQPLVVGLGGEHVLETSITLCHITGAPIIPGSALKGLARTFALLELAETLQIPASKADEPILKPLDDLLSDSSVDAQDIEKLTGAHYTDVISEAVARFRKAFGTISQSGCAIFFEGLYAGDKPPRFVVDMMNPHFNRYYGNPPSAPSDDDSPVPVPYVTVAHNQPFVFAVAARSASDAEFVYRYPRTWLERGLLEVGIGAKTNQGYGLFKA